MPNNDKIFNNDMDIEKRIKPLFATWFLVLFVGGIFSLGVVGFISLIIEVLNWNWK